MYLIVFARNCSAEVPTHRIRNTSTVPTHPHHQSCPPLDSSDALKAHLTHCQSKHINNLQSKQAHHHPPTHIHKEKSIFNCFRFSLFYYSVHSFKNLFYLSVHSLKNILHLTNQSLERICTLKRMRKD